MRPLPDRGVLFARVLGLLLVAWVTWWLVSSGLLQFSLISIVVAMALVAVPSAAVLWKQWRSILDWLRENWRLVATAEALFLLAYLAFLLIRAANPDLWHPWRGGEKPMELAYFTAVARSSVLPPFDPWFSGGHLNYYYWGYFILSVPLRLTGIPPATAFNVAVPLIFALTATGMSDRWCTTWLPSHTDVLLPRGCDPGGIYPAEDYTNARFPARWWRGTTVAGGY